MDKDARIAELTRELRSVVARLRTIMNTTKADWTDEDKLFFRADIAQAEAVLEGGA